MNNVVEFPLNDPMAFYVNKIHQGFTAEQWAKLEPVITDLLKRHGQLPEIKIDIAVPATMPDEQLAELKRLWRNSVYEYGTMCRGIVLAELAATLMLNAEQREQLAKYEK